MVICLVPAAGGSGRWPRRPVRPTRTGSASSSGSSFCTRERSMSSCTRLVSRVASYLHAAGEALDRLRVVGGVHDGLGEQGERTDRGLQLMADVRDEVAPYGLDSAGLGEVLDQEEHQPGAERGDPGGDREGLAAAGAAPGQVQLDLSYLAVAPGVAGHLKHRLDGELAAADQSEGVRGGAGLDHGVGLVEHDGGGAQHGQHGVDAGREHRVGVQGDAGGARLVALAPAERQHGDDAGAHTGDRCRCGDRRVHVHAPRLCASADTAPSRNPSASSNTRRPEFTSRIRADSLAGSEADAFRTDRGSVEVPIGPLPEPDRTRGRRTAMRDAYHEELDSIGDGLVEMARLVGLRDRARHHGDARRRPEAGRERDRRRREGRRSAARPGGPGHRAAGPAAAGRHGSADRRHLAADERRPGALRRPGPARRQAGPAALPRVGRAARPARDASWRWGSSRSV